jgi:hypothetical protein
MARRSHKYPHGPSLNRPIRLTRLIFNLAEIPGNGVWSTFAFDIHACR